MSDFLKRAGLPLTALIGATFAFLPILDAFLFLSSLTLVPVSILVTSKFPISVREQITPWMSLKYVSIPLIAVAASLPVWADAFQLRFYSEMLILGLLAMSLDVMMGYIGLASFAHAALAGVSAYMTAIALTHLGWGPWVAIGSALVAGTTVTTFMGAFSVRVRDIYFGIITLVFGVVAFIIANSWVSVTNGEDGMTIDLPELSIFGLFSIDTGDFSSFWYLTFSVVFLSYVFLRKFMKSSVGLVFHGIRENEERARYIGYNVNAYKIFNTAVSGFFTSIAGVLLILKNGIIGTEQMDVIHSGEVVIWSVIGGLGTLIGPFIGAGFVYYLTDYLSEFTERYVLIVGLIFIVTILLAPSGIVGAIKESWQAAVEHKEDEL